MRKSIQQKLFLTLCAFTPAVAGATLISPEQAKEVAAEFFQSGDLHRLGRAEALVLAYTALDGSSNPTCYVFNAKDGKGFAIVSADDQYMPVIGYSDTSVWDAAQMPGSAREMISAPVTMAQASARKKVLARAAQSEKVLKTPEWSQEAPFNYNIPNRRLTGCVGVALAEILKFHNYPASRPASLVNDGEDTAYAWSSMRDDNYRSGYSSEEANAVAALVADAAIAIGTDFGMSSSSAFEVKVPYALTSMFGYDAGVAYKKRAELDKASWDALIVNEIDEDRPVLYSGQDVSAGHAFVCDGYQMRGETPYFHINWGWGGSANGYYASDALNPVVSKAHHYNDLMTVVYNIKPSASALEWSPIHVTSDESQPGLTVDTDDISSVSKFTVRAGALKNISNSDFSGKLAVALYGADGKQKCLLSDPRNFNIVALQISKYVDFTCSLPAGTAVADGDVVRLATQGADGAWLPVAGDNRLSPGDAPAKGGALSYFNVIVPASADFVEITPGEGRVIKGRDYKFKVVPTAADKVVTVKANGFILTPDASNNYTLTNVLADQEVTILVQNAADVLSKSTLWVTSGNLQNLLTEQEAATVKDLTLFGTINANDFNFMRDRMKLERLDISQVSITALGSNPANAIPTKAFMSYRSLKQIVLPNNLTTFKNACFGLTGLTSVDIPASVGTWEYNVFANCTSLREVTVRRAAPAWVNWCVFTNTPQAKLTVPVGAKAAYEAKEYWQDFKEIVEGVPEPASTFSVTIAEKKGLKFTSLTDGTVFSKGDTYQFKVETDDSFADYTMKVYCNATQLTPDADGVYTATINSNSLLHVEFQAPLGVTTDATWKLTGEAGGIGLVTSVVNVPFGQNFVVRANAIKVPGGNDAAKFYAIVLTDSKGGIKEFISSIVSNYYSYEAKNITYNFNCKVTESTVQPGNRIRLATSYDKKNWQLVEGDADSIAYSLPAIGNPVVLHQVTMPSSVTGARIEGASSEVVRGMPFTVKASAINPAQRVTIAVNGENKAHKVPNATVSIPAVLEDLDITISVSDADAGDYMVFNIQEGKLAEILQDCPDRVKLIGTMHVSDFDALRANAGTIIDLDLSEVTIRGAAMTGNQIPENAFAPSNSSTLSALKSVILPNGIERIQKNAFARCTQISELTIPAGVNYIGDGAFSACTSLRKIIAKPKVAPTCGNLSPFPSGAGNIVLEVPKGSEESYSVGSTWWSLLNLNKPSAEQKDYYWIKVNESRAKAQSFSGSLLNIGIGAADTEIIFELPNSQQSQFKAEYQTHLRKGVPFKVYDNGIDVFANLGAYQYNSGMQYYWPNHHWSQTGGRLGIRFNHSATSGTTMIQNHELEIYFYYAVNFENKAGGEGITAEIIEKPDGCEWTNVPMNYFELTNSKVIPVLYREGSEMKFQLTNIPDKTEPVVSLMTKVMTVTGKNPVYEEREMTLTGNNGIYTIPALEGDTWIRISGTRSFDEGDVIPAEAISSVKPEDAVAFSELTVSGDMGEEDFEAIRENFSGIETLDLSQLENEVIPEGAFAGMEALSSVIIPETVTEIGAGAFAGCENIESITLPGVNSIGEGAFEGCTGLTSILIPSSDGTPAPSGAPRKIAARNDGGISAESFRGLSPNCLIYIGSNEIPDSEELNIILNKDGNRVAASDIHLDGNHSFNAPASFMLGDHKITFTADVTASDACDVDGGWSTIILPFQPTEMIIGEEFAERAGSGVHLVSFDGEEAEELTAQTQLLPNRPYLANVCAPFASVPVTFVGSAREQVEGEGVVYDVPFTPVPEETVAVGKEFSLYGSYDGQTRPVVCYMLNEEGSTFVRPESSDSEVAVKPFSAYLVANEGTDKAEMAAGTHPLWIHEPASMGAAGTKLYRSEKIDMASATAKASIYYTVDGTDPKDAEGTRVLFSEPFAMADESLDIKAVAEYKGNISDVVDLAFELKKVNLDYNLAQNWNWISQISENAVAVEDFATDGIESILSQTQEVVRDKNYGLVGSLKEIAPAVGYKVSVSSDSWNGNVAGVAFDPNVSVKLNKGWNWIGTPIDEGSLLIEDLLAALKAEEGDMLVGLDGFVQADADSIWKGTLSHMVPGEGYMFYSNSDKEFAYNIVAAHDTVAPAKAPVVEGYWTVDNHKYASVMPVVASLEGEDAEGFTLAAFCGDECRGIAQVVDGVFMINVHGNKGDMINFRFIGEDNEEKQSATSVAFEVKPAGTFAAPVAIAVSGATAVETIGAGEFGFSYEDGNFIFNGDLSGVKAIEIYDLSGKMIAKSAGARTLKVGNIEGSVVTVVVLTDSGRVSHTMIVK